jgi:polyisoprenoid-binding protein YceI
MERALLSRCGSKDLNATVLRHCDLEEQSVRHSGSKKKLSFSITVQIKRAWFGLKAVWFGSDEIRDGASD